MTVDSAFAVHSTLGPGLLESIYERCLAYEIRSRGFAAQSQVGAPVVYRDLRMENGYRIDLVVEQALAVEVKAVERLLPVHEAQLLTYLKVSGLTLGLLINFNVPLIKQGVRRIILSPP